MDYRVDKVGNELILMKDYWFPVGGAFLETEGPRQTEWRVEIGVAPNVEIVDWRWNSDGATELLLERAIALKL